MKRVILLVPVVALLAACGSSSSPRRQALADTTRPQCPAAWRAGWQKLANRAHAPVFCPSWMPDPLNARIGGVYTDINSVDKRDHSYLISFVWFESGAEVHVNFRGYPGRTRIPTCSDLDTNKPVPCFADQKGAVRERGLAARVYTANQGVDMWHVLYAWRYKGSLYTISEHVAFPYTYAETVQNLKRMLRGLVVVEPSK